MVGEALQAKLVAKNLRFPGQLHGSMSETELNYNYMRDYDPQTGRYVESDPMGLTAGINTYAYSKSEPTALIDPDGLCPAVLDTGTFDSAISRDKCIRNHKVAYYEYQTRSQFIGTLIGTEGDCNCPQQTQTCVYSLVLYQADRVAPCGGGPFSPWGESVGGPARTLRAPVDCKSGQFNLKDFTLNGYGQKK